MLRGAPLGIIFALLIASSDLASVRADMIPGPGVRAIVQFNNIDEYPDYDFYLKYRHRDKGPKLDKVESGKEMVLAPGYVFGEVFLIAVPRGQALVAPKEGTQEWLLDAPDGGLQSNRLEGKEGAPLKTGYAVAYRVQVKDGRLHIHCVDTHLDLGSAAAPYLCVAMPIAFLLSPIAIAVFAIYMARRLRRRST